MGRRTLVIEKSGRGVSVKRHEDGSCVDSGYFDSLGEADAYMDRWMTGEAETPALPKFAVGQILAVPATVIEVDADDPDMMYGLRFDTEDEDVLWFSEADLDGVEEVGVEEGAT